ncbi:DUF2971 domain-containing protein [Lentimicrobium sp. S6]|uniref:DUF2971 domain-containing protein n=1 Tax=Lentimicrobium sp. S6 TaxID=2735872 RepID=UPI00155385E9|nr:DUF2971 domain-containing protein [Lentimicrobium sp. S6]NPD48022.1 DUF2971 domain-containing protein [Lentimicrobium sp. S6]
MKNPPDKLYHYCSVESMFNIIKSKSLWLSNSGQMNDSEESTWIEQYFDIIKDSFKQKKYEPYLDKIFNVYYDDLGSSFIFCLSDKKDSLSQWRGYSDDGRGVSIGFSREQLNIFEYLPHLRNSQILTISLIPVIYSESIQQQKIHEILKNTKNDIDTYPHHSKTPFSYQFAKELLLLTQSYKNPSFEEESEWRLIFTPNTSGFSVKKEITNIISDLNFRCTKDKIISYYKQSLENKFNSKLIPEIVLGPKSKIDIPEFKLFLKANGLEGTEVTPSDSTYR